MKRRRSGNSSFSFCFCNLLISRFKSIHLYNSPFSFSNEVILMPTEEQEMMKKCTALKMISLWQVP